MSRRIHPINYLFIVLLFAVSAGGSMAAAQQDSKSKGQQIMTPLSGPSRAADEESADPRKSFIHRLHFENFEAAMGNPSLCAGGDEYCLADVKEMKSWICAASACDGTDKSKKPLDCFDKWADQNIKEVQNQMNSSFCSLVDSPSALTRQALLRRLSDKSFSHVPGGMEDYLVEFGSNLMAIKGSAVSCENYIKNYVGAYGSQWNPEWYRELSGCRILAHERTRVQEEKDFLTWFGVVNGSGHCSDIINSEMRKACSAPGAASPIP